MAAIAAAKSPSAIGTAGKQPGNQVDAVHLWSIANIALVGRQILAPFGMIDPVTDLATLERWLDRAITAASVSDVLG